MNSALAPIALFAYNRPEHLLQCLRSLKENVLAAKSTLYVYSDGKKSDASDDDIKKIEECRRIIKQESWCQEVIVIEQDQNLGLAASIIRGVTDVINRHGKIIVLEDDLIFSNFFLNYMNDCLDKYSGMENIYSVNGYMFPIGVEERNTFLLPYTSTWGWATWKSKWDLFTSEIPEEDKQLLAGDPLLKDRFNLSDYDYTSMLGFKNNSWGIKWYYSVFVRNGLNVFPTHSLVSHIGNDGSGTNHTGQGDKIVFDKNNSILIKIENKLNLKYLSLYQSFFTNPKKNKIKSFIRKTLRKS